MTRKGSLIVARGETKTITRHVTFFKKVTEDFEVDTSTLVTEQVPPGNQRIVADMIHPLHNTTCTCKL